MLIGNKKIKKKCCSEKFCISVQEPNFKNTSMLKNWGFYEKEFSIINQTQYFVYIIYLLYGQGSDYDRYWYILNLLPSKINIYCDLFLCSTDITNKNGLL